MDNYYWSYSRTAEVWYESGETIEDCIRQAKELNDDNHSVVYIGEAVPFVPSQHLNVDRLLDDLCEQAYDFAGEAAEDWEPYDCKKREEMKSLHDAIGAVVDNWLKEHDRYPTFSTIENITEYSL